MKHCFYQYLIVKRCSCQYRKSLASGVVYVSDFQNICARIVTYTSFLLLAVIFLNERPDMSIFMNHLKSNNFFL